MPRKTRGLRGAVVIGTDGFNEAAARCRGNVDDEQRRVAVALASMRPRPDAAENTKIDAAGNVVGMPLQ